MTQDRIEPQVLYEAIVSFLIANGLRREEFGSGWWWGEAVEVESGLGDAVEYLLQSKFELDLREAIPNEPQEFWG